VYEIQIRHAHHLRTDDDECKNGATNEFNKVPCERLSPNQSYHTQDGAANANLLNKIGGQGQAHGPDKKSKMQSSQKEAALHYPRNNLKTSSLAK